MDIIQISNQVSPQWQYLVDKYASDIFHSPDWLNVLSETYGFTFHAAILLDSDGSPEAGLPFCEVEDIKRKRIVTLPFSDYCDPLVENYAQWAELTKSLFDHVNSYTIRCVHNDIPLSDERFELTNKAKWHGMSLDQDQEDLWRGLHESTRRAIKKARKEDVVVRMARDEKDLRSFFRLHLNIRKYKYRMVAQPFKFFNAIWTQIIEAQKGFLMLATHRGEIVGGVLFLIWKNRLYYKFNASSQEHLSVRPNDMIIWEGIKHGKSLGLDYLDFGLSDWDQEGLVRYKRKFSSDEKTISFLRTRTYDGGTYQEQNISSLLPRLTDLFTDDSVPDEITEQAGNLLYKFFV